MKMKSVTTHAIFLLSSLYSGVSAENVMRVLFNEGKQDSRFSCDDADWAKIDPIFDAVKPTLRNLRQVNAASNKQTMDFEIDVVGNDKNSIEKKRKLLIKAKCKNLCAGQVAGTYCRATGCTGYLVRRKLVEDWCTTTSLAINSQLNSLVTEKLVSSPCQLLLSASRKIICIDDILFGEVEAFNFWDSDSDTVLKVDAHDKYTVCPTKHINIEVQVNPCVESVTIRLTGPDGSSVTKTQGSLPFSIFGSSGNNMNGRALAPGDYKMTAIPDGIHQNLKELEFVVAEKC